MSDKKSGEGASSGGASGSDTPKKNGKGKQQLMDPNLKAVIKENMKQVLNKLGNITEVIVNKNKELKGDSAQEPAIVKSLEKAHQIMKKLDDK